MTVRIGIAVVLAAVALVVIWRLRAKPRGAHVQDRYPVPRQLHRRDFPRPEAPWLVALFSAERCNSCKGIPQKLAVLESDEVATAVVDDETQRDVHKRYDISGIPTVVIADGEGVVQRAFVGPLTATDLWAAVAELRSPGTTPEPDLGGL